jgi:LPS-assembly lipoprotein
MMSQLSRMILPLIMALLVGCGYHIRGSIEMPEVLKNLYVFGASEPLKGELLSILKASKGKIVGSPNDAGVVVKVLREDMRNRVLTIGSTGKSSESELEYYLRFQLFDSKENALMDEQLIEISREFFNDQTAVLAKGNEEQLIRNEIYKQVARMILARAQIAVETQKK